MSRLYIVGASGHGRVVADIALLNGYKQIFFLDDNEEIKECAGYSVVGRSTEAHKGEEVFIAIGDAEVRKRLMDHYANTTIPFLIHPKSIIAKDVEIGIGSVVMAGAVINPGARIGKGCIINTSSSIDHDCYIGDYSHISVGTHLCGTVVVDDFSWIGAGSTVSNNIHICKNCIIGAGSVVIKSIKAPGTYVGVPAKQIKK